MAKGDFDIKGLSFSDVADLVEIREDNSKIIKEAMGSAIIRALEKIGLVAEGYAKKLCPVDTGRLRNSITHQLDGKESVYIGTNVEYAPYVELGTNKRAAQKFLRPAAEDHASEYRQILENELRGG